MKRYSVILAHPQKGSFNHSLAKNVVEELMDNNIHVDFHDLYSEKFDPILPGDEIPDDARLSTEIQTHCDQIALADGIIIVHPNWWGQPPAILKGWIDRVIRPNVAYKFEEGDNGEGVPIGLLKAQVACVFNTSNTPAERENNVFGDPLERLWKNCIFDLCGVKIFYRKMYRIIITSSKEQRSAWIQDARRVVKNLILSGNQD